MDTVSMLNKMRFYCQPILPLVYDESMSYYETLCKVVGQLNTTGETINKLNEGLTGEIADRQAADAELDARLKVIEDTNAKTHFLVFDGANPNVIMPTRDELYNWVNNGDAIITLFSTHEEGRGLTYAASCSYNAGDWGAVASDDFNIIVPLETTYDTNNDYAIRQKVAKLTIPRMSVGTLNSPWGLQFIEINTPSTSADGVVNFAANIFQDGHMECNLTPFEFKNLYAPTWANRNLCVAVNAKLFYDGYTRTSSIATLNSSNHIIRIAFERDGGVYTDNGVKQLNKTIDYIIGDVSTNVWTHETIDSEVFDFDRYEGFQFTRGAGNVITTDDESTPNAVWAQYQSDHSGRIYQNLPVRLIDTVDNVEYWNGVFDIKDGKHMTFTFSSAKYDAISDEMHVNIIELSADVNTAAWKYSAKVIDLPYRQTSFSLDVWKANETPTIVDGVVTYEGNSNLDYDTIRELVDGSQDIVAMLHDGTSETSPEWSSLVYSAKAVGETEMIRFAATSGLGLDNGMPAMDCAVGFTKDDSGATKVQIMFAGALPAPSANGNDDGKVPTVVGNKWGLETPSGGGTTPGGSSHAVLYAPQVLTEEQKKQARENVDAAIGDFAVNATYNSSDGSFTLDKTEEQIREAISAGKRPFIVVMFGPNTYAYYPLSEYTESYLDFNRPSCSGDVPYLEQIRVNRGRAISRDIELLSYISDGVISQVKMDSPPTQDMQIATKKYVDDSVHSPNVEDMTSAWNPTVQSSKSGEVVINDKHLFYYPGLDAVYFSLYLIGFRVADVAGTLFINMNISSPINGISLAPKIDTGFAAQLFVQPVSGLAYNSAIVPAHLNTRGGLTIILTEDSPGGVTSYGMINGWYLANNHSSN